MFAADVFAGCSGVTNRFLVFVDDTSEPLKHLRPFDGLRVVHRRRYFGSPSVDDDLAWCDCLIVHYLDTRGARMILAAPRRARVVWSGWGGDYYDLLPDSDRELLAPGTMRLLARTRRPSNSLFQRVRDEFREGATAIRRRMALSLIHRAIHRVELFSAPIPEDFAVLARVTGSAVHAQFHQLNYASVEHTFSNGPGQLTGDDILVGNSATPTNNHVDVFDLLARIDLGSRRIIVPLSYGDQSYRDAVISYGEELFGDRFVPIVSYMPLAEYNALIAGCSISVMGHLRQQALGNVAAMLRLGAKVFLDEKNPLRASLLRRGAVVPGLSDLRTGGPDVLAPLTTEQRQENGRVVQTSWSHDVVTRNAQALLDRLRPCDSCADA